MTIDVVRIEMDLLLDTICLSAPIPDTFHGYGDQALELVNVFAGVQDYKITIRKTFIDCLDNGCDLALGPCSRCRQRAITGATGIRNTRLAYRSSNAAPVLQKHRVSIRVRGGHVAT